MYYLLLQSGKTVRLAGITVRDPDVMNNSILVELNCSQGFISLPSLPRLSALVLLNSDFPLLLKAYCP